MYTILVEKDVPQYTRFVPGNLDNTAFALDYYLIHDVPCRTESSRFQFDSGKVCGYTSKAFFVSYHIVVPVLPFFVLTPLTGEKVENGSTGTMVYNS